MMRFTRPFLISFLFLYSLTATAQRDELLAMIEQTEIALAARLGVTVTVLNSGARWDYHSEDRFPLSSTFKTIACAALLHRVDAGTERLDRRVRFTPDDLVTYSPVTETRTGDGGMMLGELCEAAITLSDNTAGNLILAAIGGPDAVTEFARATGDEFTRLNRWETDLNEAVPGDVRDTTTPSAMAKLLSELVFGTTLSTDSRNTLIAWLKGNAVGDALLRAGIPAGWEIGDKTGAGGYGSRSIAAVMWPPGGDPVIATIYITETEASMDARNQAIADIGRAIAHAVAD